MEVDDAEEELFFVSAIEQVQKVVLLSSKKAYANVGESQGKILKQVMCVNAIGYAMSAHTDPIFS